jgi:hypothetical protein
MLLLLLLLLAMAAWAPTLLVVFELTSTQRPQIYDQDDTPQHTYIHT